MVSVSNQSNFQGQKSRLCVANVMTPSRHNNSNAVLRTVQAQHGNTIMSSDLLFLDMDTIASKSNCVDLVSPSTPENLWSPLPAQENMLTACRNEGSNFDT